MKIFVLNSGSSSLKFKLYAVGDMFSVIAEGMVEKIGESESFISVDIKREKVVCRDHKEALALVEKQLRKMNILEDFGTLDAIAHRVVHGGALFVEPAFIDEAVIAQIKAMIPLAPLHNPANLEGILAMRHLVGNCPQIAFFDTAFHQSMPELSYRYALPDAYYTKMAIRRYGFHGISHQYLAKKAAKLLDRSLEKCNLITLHLGNGASATAIQNGKSLDTSMGFTPLEGLVMGTRSGDLDPGIVLFLSRQKEMDTQTLDHLLNEQSGLKGLCGSNDMREIIQKMQAKEPAATLAFNLFCHRIKLYIGAYIAVLGRVDAIVFSGGIGANSPQVRAQVCAKMDHLGIYPDTDKNKNTAVTFSQENSPIVLLAMPTDEELEMVTQSVALLEKR